MQMNLSAESDARWLQRWRAHHQCWKAFLVFPVLLGHLVWVRWSASWSQAVFGEGKEHEKGFRRRSTVLNCRGATFKTKNMCNIMTLVFFGILWPKLEDYELQRSRTCFWFASCFLLRLVAWMPFGSSFQTGLAALKSLTAQLANSFWRQKHWILCCDYTIYYGSNEACFEVLDC